MLGIAGDVARAGHHVEPAAEIAVDLAQFAHRIVKGNDADAQIRAELFGGIPQGEQRFAGVEQRIADEHGSFSALGDRARPRQRGGGFADQPLCVRVQRAARIRQGHATAAAHEQAEPHVSLERVELLFDRRRREEQRLGGAVDAAAFRDPDKGFDKFRDHLSPPFL